MTSTLLVRQQGSRARSWSVSICSTLTVSLLRVRSCRSITDQSRNPPQASDFESVDVCATSCHADSDKDNLPARSATAFASPRGCRSCSPACRCGSSHPTFPWWIIPPLGLGVAPAESAGPVICRCSVGRARGAVGIRRWILLAATSGCSPCKQLPFDLHALHFNSNVTFFTCSNFV